MYHIPHSRRAETLEMSHFVVYDGLKHLKKTLEMSHFVVYDGFKHLRGVHEEIAADVDKEGCFSVDGRGIIRGRRDGLERWDAKGFWVTLCPALCP